METVFDLIGTTGWVLLIIQAFKLIGSHYEREKRRHKQRILPPLEQLPVPDVPSPAEAHEALQSDSLEAARGSDGSVGSANAFPNTSSESETSTYYSAVEEQPWPGSTSRDSGSGVWTLSHNLGPLVIQPNGSLTMTPGPRVTASASWDVRKSYVPLSKWTNRPQCQTVIDICESAARAAERDSSVSIMEPESEQSLSDLLACQDQQESISTSDINYSDKFPSEAVFRSSVSKITFGKSVKDQGGCCIAVASEDSLTGIGETVSSTTVVLAKPSSIQITEEVFKDDDDDTSTEYTRDIVLEIPTRSQDEIGPILQLDKSSETLTEQEEESSVELRSSHQFSETRVEPRSSTSMGRWSSRADFFCDE